MKITSPVFSKKSKEKNECVMIRCSVEKSIWLSFKTLVSLKGLEIKDVLCSIIKDWVVNFGQHTCENCRKRIDNDNCAIIVSEGIAKYFCEDCYLCGGSEVYDEIL